MIRNYHMLGVLTGYGPEREGAINHIWGLTARGWYVNATQVGGLVGSKGANMARKPNPEAGKRYPMNMRTTRELRERIIAAAHASGRSLVAEVEYRLERSFEKENEARLIEAVATAAATAAVKLVPFGTSPQSAGQEKLAQPEQHSETQEERVLGLATKAATAAIDQAFIRLQLFQRLLKTPRADTERGSETISGELPQLPFEAMSDEDQQLPGKYRDRTDAEAEP